MTGTVKPLDPIDCPKCQTFAIVSMGTAPHPYLPKQHVLKGYYVHCFSGECGNQSEIYRTEQEAVAAWNAQV